MHDGDILLNPVVVPQVEDGVWRVEVVDILKVSEGDIDAKLLEVRGINSRQD